MKFSIILPVYDEGPGITAAIKGIRETPGGREAEIIASRTPDADERFHREMAGIALSFRNYSLEKPPSVSEMIDFANALRLLGTDHVTEDLRDVLLPFLAKTEKDRRHLLLREGFKSLLDDGARFAARLTVPEATE